MATLAELTIQVEKLEFRLNLKESGCRDTVDHVRLIDLVDGKGHSEAKRLRLWAAHMNRSHD